MYSGNYLNGGSSRGGAYGFKLSTLLKLKDVKATAGGSGGGSSGGGGGGGGGSEHGSTLLEFLVKQCAEKHPELMGWATEELKSVVAAERLSLTQLEGTTYTPHTTHTHTRARARAYMHMTCIGTHADVSSDRPQCLSSVLEAR